MYPLLETTSVNDESFHFIWTCVLKYVVRIVVQHGNLVNNLKASAVAIAKEYTIEETLYCNVARDMAPAYFFALYRQ